MYYHIAGYQDDEDFKQEGFGSINIYGYLRQDINDRMCHNANPEILCFDIKS